MSIATPYATSEPTYPAPLFSFLAPVHAALRPIGYPVMRIAVGLAFVPHGWAKIQMLLSGKTAGFEKFLAHLGLVPPHAWLIVLTIVEFLGGLLLAAGLLTRLAAVAVGIDLLLIIILVFGPRGFAAYELLLLWGIMVFGIGCIGGGPYSLDALIGREL